MSDLRVQMSDNIMKAYKQQSIQLSLEEVKKYLQNNEEAEVLKYLQKFEMVHENMTLGR